MLKALIFDVDGTLANTERDGHRVAFNLAFEDANLDWHWDVDCYGDLLAVTGGKERIRYYAEQHDTGFLTQPNADVRIKTLHASKTRHYIELLSDGRIPLRSGVKRLLDEARNAGLTLAIATTTTPENVTALLENTLGTHAISWFKSIAAGDIVQAKKPAPDIYDYVLDELSLKPEQCIAFEDSENGILSSRAAKLATIVTTNNYTDTHDFSGAALVLDQYGEPNLAVKILSGQLDNSFLSLNDIVNIHSKI